LQTLIPNDAIKYLQSKAGKHGVYIMAGKPKGEETTSLLSFAIGNVQLITKKLTGQFPNYQAVMPAKFRLMMPIDSPSEIAKTLGRVAKCADERGGAVRWTLDPAAGAVISAESTGMGWAKAKLAASVIPIVTETAGDNESGDVESVLTIGLQSEYISQFLKIAGDEPVTMNLRDGQSAAMFSAFNENKGYDWKYVVMPMRI
jgi:DNA polymerase-3 subunit beta